MTSKAADEEKSISHFREPQKNEKLVKHLLYYYIFVLNRQLNAADFFYFFLHPDGVDMTSTSQTLSAWMTLLQATRVQTWLVSFPDPIPLLSSHVSLSSQ